MQYNWCSHKKRKFEHRHTQREDGVRTQGEGSHLLQEGRFPGGSVVKNPTAKAGDIGEACLILGSGRFPGGENGNSLQYSCRDNSMDREAWLLQSTRSQRVRLQTTVHEVTKNQTRRSNWACLHKPRREASGGTNSADSLIWDFWHPQLRK